MNSKVDHMKNRRNFQMSYHDKDYHRHIQRAVEEMQDADEVDVILHVPKVTKGNNRHVDAALYLKSMA